MIYRRPALGRGQSINCPRPFSVRRRSAMFWFHQGLKWMTVSALVRLRPMPPALSEMRKTGMPILPEPSLAERAQVMLDHAALACKYKGERIAMQEMRKQIGWYVKGLPHAAALRRDACTLNTLDDLRALLAREGFLTA